MDDEHTRELNALRERVAQLELTVAALVRELTESGTIHAQRARPRRPVTPDEIDAAFRKEPSAKLPSGGSPYRSRGPNVVVCSVCAKPLDPDEPELATRSGGPACVACFQRS